jgi:hypothetical protein
MFAFRRALLTAVATAGLVAFGAPAGAFAASADQIPPEFGSNGDTSTTTTSSEQSSSSTSSESGGSSFQAKDKNCDDFATQAEAQAELLKDPGDPNHLDGDHDGWACESKFGPPPVKTDQVRAKPAGGVATGGTQNDGQDPGGPGALVALGGLLLLGAGSGGVLVLRRRARQ